MQGNNPKDFLASPWKWQYSPENFGEQNLPPDLRGQAGNFSSDKLYTRLEKDYLKPWEHMKMTTGERDHSAHDCVLRCLDAGRRGRCDSGLGRAEVAPLADVVAPSHLLNVMKAEAHDGKEDTKAFFDALTNRKPTQFYVRRLMQLCDEWEIVWQGGQADDYDDENERTRGRFPYIDEQAALVDDLQLKSILRLRHKTKRRRSPKWIEAVYQMKKGRSEYERRRQVNKEEADQRKGVVKQALGTA